MAAPKNILKRLLIMLTGAGVLLGAAFFMMQFVFMWGDLCGNDIEQSVYSPDGKYKIVVFVRNCGATTAFSKEVSVLHAGDELENEGGNFMVFKGEPPLKVVWKTDTEFILTLKRGGRRIAGCLEETSTGEIKLTKEET